MNWARPLKGEVIPFPRKVFLGQKKTSASNFFFRKSFDLRFWELFVLGPIHSFPGSFEIFEISEVYLYPFKVPPIGIFGPKMANLKVWVISWEDPFFFGKNIITILKKRKSPKKYIYWKIRKNIRKKRISIWKNEPLKFHHTITGRPSQNASKTFGNRLEIFLWYLEPA